MFLLVPPTEIAVQKNCFPEDLCAHNVMLWHREIINLEVNVATLESSECPMPLRPMHSRNIPGLLFSAYTLTEHSSCSGTSASCCAVQERCCTIIEFCLKLFFLIVTGTASLQENSAGHCISNICQRVQQVVKFSLFCKAKRSKELFSAWLRCLTPSYTAWNSVLQLSQPVKHHKD